MSARVLMIPSYYPELGRPYAGSFVRDQALTLHRFGQRIDVAYVELRSWRQISWAHLKDSHFQVSTQVEDELLTIRRRGWNPHIRSVPGALTWVSMTRHLVESYLKKYGKPELLHAHNALWAGYAASLISREHLVPYIITEHSSAFVMGRVPPHLSRYASRAYARAAEVIAVSHSLAHSLRAYVTDRTATVIPNVVDTDFFAPAELPPASRPFKFLAVGNLVANKRFDLLIRAFASQRRDCSEVELEIVGSGPCQSSLRKLALECGVGTVVRFAGQLSRTEVRNRMRQCHVLVLPSMHETFGVVLIEALSVGMPVIATRAGGPADIVTPEVGILVDPGDCEGLSQAMSEVRGSNRFSRDQLREYAVQRFGATRFASDYHALCQRALAVGDHIATSSYG